MLEDLLKSALFHLAAFNVGISAPDNEFRIENGLKTSVQFHVFPFGEAAWTALSSTGELA